MDGYGVHNLVRQLLLWRWLGVADGSQGRLADIVPLSDSAHNGGRIDFHRHSAGSNSLIGSGAVVVRNPSVSDVSISTIQVHA